MFSISRSLARLRILIMKRILHLSSIVIVIAKGVAVSLALVAVAPALYAAEEELQTDVTIKANNGK